MSQDARPNGTKTGRGSLATPDVKALWREAWRVYRSAPGCDRLPTNLQNTARINYVMRVLNLTRKQAKRRVRNYRAADREGRM